MNKKKKIIHYLKKIIKYISENLRRGYRKEDLINAALGQGWKKDDVDEVLERI